MSIKELKEKGDYGLIHEFYRGSNSVRRSELASGKGVWA